MELSAGDSHGERVREQRAQFAAIKLPGRHRDAGAGSRPHTMEDTLGARMRSPDPEVRRAVMQEIRARARRRDTAPAEVGVRSPATVEPAAKPAPGASLAPVSASSLEPLEAAPMGLDAVVSEPERLELMRASVDVLRRGLRATRMVPVMERGAVIRHDKVPDFAERKNSARELLDRLSTKARGPMVAGIQVMIIQPPWFGPGPQHEIIDVTAQDVSVLSLPG